MFSWCFVLIGERRRQDAEQQYLLVRLAEEKDNIKGLVRNVLITWRGRDIPHLLKGKYHEHKVSRSPLATVCLTVAPGERRGGANGFPVVTCAAGHCRQDV